MSLVRNSMTIGALTLVSRILGFVRDMLMARFVGAGMAADAFLIAWRLPNLFRALFAEGAFSAAFVPMFNRKMAKDGGSLGKAVDFASAALSVLFPILLIFTVVMMALTAPIVWAMTGGFPDGGEDKFLLATELTRLTFPYLALISIVSLLGGILNSLDRFWVNAAAPVLLNVCLITALIFFRGETTIDTARSQAIAVTISGALQLLWLIWACKRANVSLRLTLPKLSPDVKDMLRVIWPAAVGAGAVQFNLLVSTSLAARFLPEGAVSYLYYADRLNQLPLGLIGIGVGTAMLPTLSRMIAAGDKTEANNTQNRAIELVLLLTLPAAAAFIVSATPLIRALLEHGVFTRANSDGSAAALAAFSLGLPAYVLIKVLTPGFYARSDTRTPVRIAMLSMLVNLIGNLALIWHFSHVGIALATALSAWVNAGLLYFMLRRRGHFKIDTRLASRGVRILLATLLMSGALLAMNPYIIPYTSGPLLQRIAALCVLIGVGGLIYFGAAFLFGVFRLQELKMMLRPRKPAKGA